MRRSKVMSSAFDTPRADLCHRKVEPFDTVQTVLSLADDNAILMTHASWAVMVSVSEAEIRTLTTALTHGTRMFQAGRCAAFGLSFGLRRSWLHCIFSVVVARITHVSSTGQEFPADSRSFATSLARILRGIARDHVPG